MKIKKLDNRFDVCLWCIFIALVICAWFVTQKISAPDFEVVKLDQEFPYEYTAEDGNKVKSTYRLAWKHDQFSKPKMVLYDSSNQTWNTIKDKYVDEYKAKMPESQYAFWQRCFWIILAVFVLVAALITFVGLGWIRDSLLYLVVKKHHSFSDCAYFLYSPRMCFKNQVKEILLQTIDDYIDAKKSVFYSKYVASFADLVMQLLGEIKKQHDTKIYFNYTYLNNTKNQISYLKDLSSYWEMQIGKNDNAVKNKEYIDSLRQKDYVDIVLKTTASDYASIVAFELKELFTEIMGEEIFNFNVCKMQNTCNQKDSGVIYVTTTIENSVNTFTWNGSGYKGKVFPGIAVRFTIHHYHNGQKIVLWNKYLTPKCTYTAAENLLVVSDLYANMVKETIRSFPESLKSDKV